jgi:hypothetical protein
MTWLRAKKTGSWDEAVAELNALYALLDTREKPGDRASLYTEIALATEEVARVIDLDVMPPLDRSEGTSYAQVYADSARLCRILAAGEMAFGRNRPRSVRLTGVLREHVPLWERYLASADRAERAELLTELYEATAAAAGYGAASVLNSACWSERAFGVSRRQPRR